MWIRGRNFVRGGDVPIETTLLFVSASIALCLAPGPDNLFVMTQSALYGRRAGVLITLGLCTGLMIHTSAVALGVAAIFQNSAVAFNGLKIAGALYLLFLAYQSFTAKPLFLTDTGDTTINSARLYGRGVLMNVANPKVAIFFLAFLPQFADSQAGSVSLQILVLGATFMLVAMFIFVGVAWFAGSLAHWLTRSERAQIMIHKVASIVFLGLALRLALLER
jgi:threonine/homoserine/homoserine lactone efflux protein